MQREIELSLPSDLKLNRDESDKEIQGAKLITEHTEKHIDAGQYLKSLVYGGLDGCINTLIIVLSGVAAGETPQKVLAICIAAIVGDGIGMGLGDYLSARSEIQYIKTEEEREMYEVVHMPQEQKKEVIEIYTAKGFSEQDANRIAQLYATNNQAFVNIMMLEELGLVVSDPIVAFKCGIVTLVSFMALGGLPVIPYIISSVMLKSGHHQTVPVICIGVVELFSLGFAKAAMIGLNKFKSGLQTLILGAAITAIGYAVGLIFKP